MLPTGFLRKVSSMLLTSLSPFPRLNLAQAPFGLDEINSLPAALQCKLLRAVDERVFEPVGSDRSQPVQARLIAASNVPLEQEVEARSGSADHRGTNAHVLHHPLQSPSDATSRLRQTPFTGRIPSAAERK